MSTKLGPMTQVSYVVEDIEKAMEQWLKIGVGPWFYVENVQVEDYRYKNKPSDLKMSVALSHSGYIQVELIQQRNDAPSLYRDVLETAGEGIHHVSYQAENFEGKHNMLLSEGFTVGMSGNIGVNGRFGYYLHEKLPGTIIELSEISGKKGKLFKAIAEAAVNWDGSNPIRR